jgi:histidinol phosphatase-like PHP family hydrolase
MRLSTVPVPRRIAKIPPLLSAENARLVRAAGIKIAISTDSHSIREYGTIRHGIEQARRAGLEKTDVLNCHHSASCGS